jgi:hypothetical protein
MELNFFEMLEATNFGELGSKISRALSGRLQMMDSGGNGDCAASFEARFMFENQARGIQQCCS